MTDTTPTMARGWQQAHPAALDFALDVLRTTEPVVGEDAPPVRALVRLLAADLATTLDALVTYLDFIVRSKAETPPAPAPGQMWLARDMSDEDDLYGAVLVVQHHEVDRDDQRVTFVSPNPYDLSGEDWATMVVPAHHARRMRGMAYRYLGEAPDAYRRALEL